MPGKLLTLRTAIVADLVMAELAAIAVELLPDHGAARAALTLPFLVFGEGHLVSTALLPRVGFDRPARIMLSIAFSAATIIVAALVVDALGQPITTTSLTIALLTVAALAFIVSAIRYPLRGPGAASSRISWRRETWVYLASTVVAAVIFAVTLVVLARPLPNARIAGYTQLWALRRPSGIVVGVLNAEHRSTSYRVVVRTAAGRSRAFGWRSQPGTTMRRVVNLPGPRLQRISVNLYRASAATGQFGLNPYRRLSLRP